MSYQYIEVFDFTAECELPADYKSVQRASSRKSESSSFSTDLEREDA